MKETTALLFWQDLGYGQPYVEITGSKHGESDSLTNFCLSICRQGT